jgi:quinol-cytochrome oxidoreductase complex cytochrome b subunit
MPYIVNNIYYTRFGVTLNLIEGLFIGLFFSCFVCFLFIEILKKLNSIKINPIFEFCFWNINLFTMYMNNYIEKHPINNLTSKNFIINIIGCLITTFIITYLMYRKKLKNYKNDIAHQ